jgi:F-box-like
MLPDDVLLDIFDFYRMDFQYYPWRWHTLAHVCRRWRCLVFASPRRLDLQFLCTPRTPVRELLEFLPPTMPIMISNWSSSSPPYDPLSLEDGTQVLSAIEQRDRVRWLHLDGVTGSLVENLATKMQGTFPIMTFVRLWSHEPDDDSDQMVPVLPEAFLGGSCPHLQTLWLYGVPFPHLPKLLFSTNDLIVLRLENIPDSGYIPCEDMVASLSTSTKLETLTIEFQSTHPPHRDGTSQQPATSPLRVALPALTLFKFKGNGGYFDNFVVRFESHLLVPDFDQGWYEHNANRRLSYEASYFPESGLRLHSESWIPH